MAEVVDSVEIRTKRTLNIRIFRRVEKIDSNTDAANCEFGSSFAFLRIMSCDECRLCSAKFDDERERDRGQHFKGMFGNSRTTAASFRFPRFEIKPPVFQVYFSCTSFFVSQFAKN